MPKVIKIEHLLDVFTRPASWSWITERYLPKGVFCPRCKTKITGSRALAAFREIGRVYCRACRSIFSARAVTPLAATEWQPEQFVKLIVLHGAGRTPGEIGDTLGKSCDAVSDMLDRIETIEAAKGEPVSSSQTGTLREQK